MLDRQYQKAIEDFKRVDSYLENDNDPARIIAFRIAFGKVVSYDNLGMEQETQQALKELQTIAEHAGCDDCIDDRLCLGVITLTSNFQNMITLVESTIHYKNNIVNVCTHQK